MSRFGYDTVHRENAFSLTFPEKRAVELRLTDKRAWLITNIDEVGGNHRKGKRDRDGVAFGNLPARRLEHNAAGFGFCIRCFFLFFFLRETCAGHGNQQNGNEKRYAMAKWRTGDSAKCGRGLSAPTGRRTKAAPTFAEWLVHCFCGASCCIRRRSASASAVFPMRRSHCSPFFYVTRGPLNFN